MSARIYAFPTGRVLREGEKPPSPFAWMMRRRRCKVCQTPLDPRHGKPGPEPVYCGSACRSRAYRERQRNG